MDDIIQEILDREGGWSDRPKDAGGATNYGVTLPTLTMWLGRKATVKDLKALTIEDAKSLYRDLYITKPGFGIIPNQKILGLVVDMAVNHGTGNAIRMLQRAVGVKDDGILGSVTKREIQAANYGSLYLKLCAERIRFYGKIITNKPDQAVFAYGWLSRAASFVERA